MLMYFVEAWEVVMGAWGVVMDYPNCVVIMDLFNALKMYIHYDHYLLDISMAYQLFHTRKSVTLIDKIIHLGNTTINRYVSISL